MPKIMSCDMSQSGLMVRGTMVHDPVRPDEEARRQIAGLPGHGVELVFVFGLGLGYHLTALADRYPTARIAVFDPDPALRANYGRRVVPDRRSDRMIILEDWDVLNGFLSEEFVPGEHGDPTVFIHPAYQSLFPKEAAVFRDVVQAARVRQGVTEKTKQEKGLLFLRNMEANFRRVLKLPLVTDLRDKLAGRPGFIVGSGPGLEKNGRLLQEAAGRGLILAASSALRPLRSLGVTPDIGVFVEGEDTSRFLEGAEGDPPLPLALASAVHPAHFEVPGYVHGAYHLTRGAAYLFGTESFVPTAGTAGTAAFSLGLIMGLNPLVLIGQDQAYGPLGLHAQGAPETANPRPFRDHFTVAGTQGQPVRTNSTFAASLHWYAESVRYLRRTRPDRVLINANESGARIPGMPEQTLGDVLQRLPVAGTVAPISISTRLAQSRRPDIPAIRDGLAQSVRILNGLSRLFGTHGEQCRTMIAEVRRSHPLLHEAWPSRLESGPDEKLQAVLLETESLFNRMREALDNDDSE